MNTELPVNLHSSCQNPIGFVGTVAASANFTDVPTRMDFSASVCQIHTLKVGMNPLQPFLNGKASRSEGSGFAIQLANKTFFVTNHHCIASGKRVSLSLPKYGAQKFPVRIVADSPEMDLTLLRISGKHNVDVKTLTIGNSDEVADGTKLIAVGFPLGQNGQKITTGGKSGNQVMHGTDYIQTDAALCPGNSGGSLLNEKDGEWEVVGINNAIIPGQNNVGYAIPSEVLKVFLDNYLYTYKNSSVDSRKQTILISKPVFGLGLEKMTDTLISFLGHESIGLRGMYVNQSVSGSVVGDQIKEDDQLLKINGYEVTRFGQCIVPWNSAGPVDMARVTSRFKLGDNIPFQIGRGGSIMDLEVDYVQKDPRIVRPIYFPYEHPKAAIYAGMVVQELNLNLVNMFMKVNPLLGKYASVSAQCDQPCLVVSFVLGGGLMSEKGNVSPSMTLNSINGKRVRTLDQLGAEIRRESKFYKVQFHDNVHVILSNEELVQDHQFISSTFGGMLRDTKLLQPVAYQGADCLVGYVHSGCEKCGGGEKKKHAHNIERKYSKPKKDNMKKNQELGLLIKNVSSERIVIEEEVICCDGCSEVTEQKVEYDAFEIEQMKAVLPVEMLEELGIF